MPVNREGADRTSRFILALCVATAVGLPRPAYAEPLPVFAVTASTHIHISSDARVYKTAIRELATIFEGTPKLHVSVDDAPAPGDILIAQLADSKAAQELARQGLISLHRVLPELDAYEILVDHGVLYLVGNTPRGMLHAVYKLEEMVREGISPNAATHIRATFQIKQRFFHQRFDDWPGGPADIRYISLLGASHCLLTHDWSGDRRHLQAYVPSAVFPNAVDPGSVDRDGRALRHLIDTCLDYGLEPALWITEFPCQGGPWVPEAERQRFLSLFPAEVLSETGTYQGKGLCFGHPQVQEYYRDLLNKFFTAYPEVSILFLFGLDSGGEFCDPTQCDRCKGISKFEQRDRLLRFLIDEGNKVRPGLRVLTTGWGWSNDTEQFLARQKALPEASGLYLAAEKDGWQAERQTHDLLWNARDVCRQRGQTFLGYDDFHWGDDTVHQLNDIQDYTLGIGAKVRRWHELGVDGVFDHWGGFNRDISCNSIACREFFLNPLADPEVVCRAIAVRQFGETAGPSAFAAWQSLERAHAILSNACSWSPRQWPGWYAGLECVPNPEGFAKPGLEGGEPPRHAGAITYNPSDLADRLQRVGDSWRLAFPHYTDALQRMREAAEKADDAPVFYAFWWAGGGTSPNRREHLRRQSLYIESMALIGREIGIHFSLNALYERVKHDPAAYNEQAVALLREDVQACRDAADFLDRIKASGDDRTGGRNWTSQYRAKADRIEKYLK